MRILGLLAVGLTAAITAWGAGTNYVVTAVSLTNTTTALVVPASTASFRKVYLRPESDCYLSLGVEITTNRAATFPVALANTYINIEGPPTGFKDAIYIRGTNAATTPKVNVNINW